MFLGRSSPELRLVRDPARRRDAAVARLEERLARHGWVHRIGFGDGATAPGEHRASRPHEGAELEIRWRGDDPLRREVVELALDEALAHEEAIRWRERATDAAERFDGVQERMVAQGRIAALGTMAASVAHDIRSPLAVLISNLGFLEQELAGAEDADVSHTLADNRLALELIEGVLESMRTFVAEHAGSGMVRLRPVVESASRLTRFHFAKARVSLDVDVVGDPVGRGTDGELCQVLMNLLSNAAEASPPGGCVRLIVRRTREHALVYVTDEGSGVADGARESIFEPFHTSKADGMGLGLAIARQMARRHGGDLRVLDEAPLRPAPPGACFELRLPARLG